MMVLLTQNLYFGELSEVEDSEIRALRMELIMAPFQSAVDA